MNVHKNARLMPRSREILVSRLERGTAAVRHHLSLPGHSGRGRRARHARQIDAIAKGVSGPVETWMIPGCGHSLHFEMTEPVCVRIAGFIKDLWQ